MNRSADQSADQRLAASARHSDTFGLGAKTGVGRRDGAGSDSGEQAHDDRPIDRGGRAFDLLSRGWQPDAPGLLLLYHRGVPDAEVHVLDAGHVALDELPALVAPLTRLFLVSASGPREDHRRY